MYKIDKGVPLTKSVHTRPFKAPLVQKIKNPGIHLEIGDSVLFKFPTEAIGFANRLRSYGQRAAVRRTNQGTRVWRVE